jgi:Icc-related predicted phosphoesterase
VAVGESSKDWSYLWEVFAPVKLKQIPILPVIGNHDLYWSQNKAKVKLAESFPDLDNSSYFHKTFGAIALIVLNSNDFSLSPEEWTAQTKWYQETIKRLENENNIRSIITCSHHPPFTNSMVIGPHKLAQKDFVPIFINSPKSKLYLSGHAHTYEHFILSNKHFVVSGGGGGQRQPLLPPFLSRINDIKPWTLFKPFHYISLEDSDQEISLRVHGYNKTMNIFETIDEFTFLKS